MRSGRPAPRNIPVRALVEPVAKVAAAIESGNVPVLTRLPGIGRYTAGAVLSFARAACRPSQRRTSLPSTSTYDESLERV